MTTDEHAGIVAKYEELCAGHLRSIQDLKRVTAQLAFCCGQRTRAVTALQGYELWPPPTYFSPQIRAELLREHEQS